MSNIGIDIEVILDVMGTLLSSDGRPVLFPNALEAIRRLKGQGHTISLVCCVQANEGVHLMQQVRTVLKDPLYFCRDEEGRKQICTNCQLTTYIDGSLLSLGQLPDPVTTRLLFRPRRSEIQQYGGLLKKVTQVENWGEIVTQLSKK